MYTGTLRGLSTLVSQRIAYIARQHLPLAQIGSVDGLRPPPQETYAYSASKAALHHMSRHLAGRLGFEGITCNTLACGRYLRFTRRFRDLTARYR